MTSPPRQHSDRSRSPAWSHPSESELSAFWDGRALAAAGTPLAHAAAGTVTDDERVVELRSKLEEAHAERLWKLSRTTRVLDLAAGAGRIGLRLASRVAHVTLLDLSPQQLQLAKLHAVKHGIANVSFIEGSLVHADYGGPYDLIVLFGACTYLGDDDVAKVAQRCRAALVPGGMLLLKEPVSTTGEPIVQQREQNGLPYRALFRPREEYTRLFGAHLRCRYHAPTCAHLIPRFMISTEHAVSAIPDGMVGRFVSSAYVRLDPWLRRVEAALRSNAVTSLLLAEVPVLQDLWLFTKETGTCSSPSW